MILDLDEILNFIQSQKRRVSWERVECRSGVVIISTIHREAAIYEINSNQFSARYRPVGRSSSPERVEGQATRKKTSESGLGPGRSSNASRTSVRPIAGAADASESSSREKSWKLRTFQLGAGNVVEVGETTGGRADGRTNRPSPELGARRTMGTIENALMARCEMSN